MPESVSYRDPRQPLPDSGYLVVLVPDKFAAAAERPQLSASDPERAERRREHVRSLRAAMPLDINRYRGMGRFTLDPFWSSDPETLASDPDAPTDRAARLLLAEADIDGHLIPELDLAKQAREAADQPEDWEIILLDRKEGRGEGDSLGYDIGWWPECYSILSDAVIDPVWHPAAPPDFPDLAELLATNNHHGLFNSANEALRYREYYVSRQWAEEEDSPFIPLRVSAVGPA